MTYFKYCENLLKLYTSWLRKKGVTVSQNIVLRSQWGKLHRFLVLLQSRLLSPLSGSCNQRRYQSFAFSRLPLLYRFLNLMLFWHLYWQLKWENYKWLVFLANERGLQESAEVCMPTLQQRMLYLYPGRRWTLSWNELRENMRAVTEKGGICLGSHSGWIKCSNE